VHARMCGFSKIKDRRIIDPPIIVEVVPGQGMDVSRRFIDNPEDFQCHITLWSPDCTEASIVVHPRYKPHMNMNFHPTSTAADKYCQCLVGNQVVGGQVLQDLDGETKIFFILNDLSVRVQGDFRLRLQLVCMPESSDTPPVVADTQFSEIFTVFPAKNFPGVRESTELAKHFWRQGVPIQIKRDFS
ncbi:velvet factor, partial [Gorgonomyces haynaldii]